MIIRFVYNLNNFNIFGLHNLNKHYELKVQQFTVTYNKQILNKCTCMSKTVKGGSKDWKFSQIRCIVHVSIRNLYCIPKRDTFYRRPLPLMKENIVRLSSEITDVHMQSIFDDAGIDKIVVNHCTSLSGHISSYVKTYRRA